MAERTAEELELELQAARLDLLRERALRTRLEHDLVSLRVTYHILWQTACGEETEKRLRAIADLNRRTVAELDALEAREKASREVVAAAPSLSAAPETGP